MIKKLSDDLNYEINLIDLVKKASDQDFETVLDYTDMYKKMMDLKEIRLDDAVLEQT